MTRTLAMALIVLSACICVLPVSDATARAVLEAEGYTAIETGHVALWGCSDSDRFASSFRAKGPSGKVVKGEVCCGWWKDCTVRVSP